MVKENKGLGASSLREDRAASPSDLSPSGSSQSGIPSAGHTPGPWLHGDTHVFALDATGNINRLYVLVQGGFLDRDTMQHTPVAELLATTRLIAAAPDLLKALENLLPLVRPFEGTLDEILAQDAGWLEVAKARAAIAKATGAA